MAGRCQRWAMRPRIPRSFCSHQLAREPDLFRGIPVPPETTPPWVRASDRGVGLFSGERVEHPLAERVGDGLTAPAGDGEPQLELELVGLDAVGALVEVALD